MSMFCGLNTKFMATDQHCVTSKNANTNHITMSRKTIQESSTKKYKLSHLGWDEKGIKKLWNTLKKTHNSLWGETCLHTISSDKKRRNAPLICEPPLKRSSDNKFITTNKQKKKIWKMSRKEVHKLKTFYNQKAKKVDVFWCNVLFL